MQQNSRHQPTEDRLHPWRVRPGEAAQGVALYTPICGIGIGRVLWREIFHNTADA